MLSFLRSLFRFPQMLHCWFQPSISVPLPVMPSIARFGRPKKSSKPVPENANSTTHVPAASTTTSNHPYRAPRISLPHVGTELNMPQYNGLFEVDSPEPQKSVEASDITISLCFPT